MNYDNDIITKMHKHKRSKVSTFSRFASDDSDVKNKRLAQLMKKLGDLRTPLISGPLPVMNTGKPDGKQADKRSSWAAYVFLVPFRKRQSAFHRQSVHTTSSSQKNHIDVARKVLFLLRKLNIRIRGIRANGRNSI